MRDSDVPDLRPSRSDLGPVTRSWVKAVGWRSVNMHTHISLVHRYVYVEVPKAGCGTMKATLGALEAARMGPGMASRVQAAPHNRLLATPFVKPFQLTNDELERVLTSSEFTRFTVVREPATRVLSGYLEKIGQGLKQSTSIIEALSDEESTIAPEDITLTQFLDVIGGQTSREQDPHWRRQVDHIGLGHVPYTEVVHLEDLDASWQRIAELTSYASIDQQYFCRTSTQASKRKDEYFTPQTLAQVQAIYADDYRMLGYSLGT